MATEPDTDERVVAAILAENSGNEHHRRAVISERVLDAMMRAVLGEEDILGQAS
jgi:hypothetical protein